MADVVGSNDENLIVFELPEIQDNESGWGPSLESLPRQFSEMNSFFAPFKKSDPMAKAADWNAKYSRSNRYQPDTFGTGASTFSFQYGEDDKDFQVVDSAASAAGGRGKRIGWQGGRGGRGGRGRGGRYRRPGTTPQQKTTRYGANFQPKRNRKQKFYSRSRGKYQAEPIKVLEPSVPIDPAWSKCMDFSFADLSKLKFDVSAIETNNLLHCGTLNAYQRSYDKVDARSPVPMQRFDNLEYFTTTTSEDPVIEKLAAKGLGNVFITDSILALLTTCTRSVLGWDIVVRKEGDQIFFDTRPNSKIHYVTVNETSRDQKKDDPVDEVNSPHNLSREATLINHNFSQQVLSKKSMRFSSPHPFPSAEGKTPCAVAYRYRQWKITPDVTVVARCELNCFTQKESSKEKVYLSVKTLNEYDLKLSGGWRSDLDSRKGGILVTEIANNMSRIARWTAQALLADIAEMRLGYVSRKTVRDSYQHVILATNRCQTKQLAKQTSINLKNMWGIFNHIVKAIRAQPDGKYLILKDPNNPKLSLFKIAADDFENETGDFETAEGD